MIINKSSIGLSVARVFQMVILFLSYKLLTFYLNEEQIGYYYAIGSYISFFNLVFLNGPSMYLTRDLFRLHKERKLLSSYIYFAIWTTLIALFSTLLIYFLKFFNLFLIENITLYVFLSVIFSTLYRNIVNGFNTLLKPKLFITFSSLSILLGLLTSIALVFYFETALSWLSGVLIVESVIVAIAFKYFFVGDQDLLEISVNKIKEIFKYCYPLAFTSLFLWIQTQSYKIITEYRYSAEALSSLALGISISSGVFAGVQAILEQIHTPQFYIDINSQSKLKREKAWNKLQDLTLPLYLLTFLFIITFANYIGKIFLSRSFENIVLYIQLGAVINLVRLLINNLQFITVSEKTTNKLIIPSLISCLVLLSLLFFIDFNLKLYLIPVSIISSFILSLIFLYVSLNRNFSVIINLKTMIMPSIPLLLFLMIDTLFTISNFWMFSIFSSYYALMFIKLINKK